VRTLGFLESWHGNMPPKVRNYGFLSLFWLIFETFRAIFGYFWAIFGLFWVILVYFVIKFCYFWGALSCHAATATHIDTILGLLAPGRNESVVVRTLGFLESWHGNMPPKVGF
jgi:hypothetical protein